MKHPGLNLGIYILMSTARHTFYNFSAAAVPLIVSLIITPIYIKSIGEERYGALAIAWLLLGYFGVFDFGLKRAVAQRIAEHGDGSCKIRANIFWTAIGLNFIFGLIGAILMWWVANWFFGENLKVNNILYVEIIGSITWLALAVPIATVSGVLSGALQGRKLFFEFNLINSIGIIAGQLLMLMVALMWTQDLRVLILVAIGVRLITVGALFFECFRKIIKGHGFCFDKTQVLSLLNMGGWVTITSIISPMMQMFDRFLIGALFGAKPVSYYTVPFQLAERGNVVAISISAAIFPNYAGANPEKAKEMTINGVSVVAALTVAPFCFAILFVGPFLSFWLTPEFSSYAAVPAKIILIGFWVNGLASILFTQLQATGRPDVPAKFHLIEVAPYFIVLYFGLNFYFLSGAAMAFLLRVFVDYCFLSIATNTINFSASKLLFPFCIVGASYFISFDGEFSVSGVVLAVILLFVSSVWSWIYLPGNLKKKIITY